MGRPTHRPAPTFGRRPPGAPPRRTAGVLLVVVFSLLVACSSGPSDEDDLFADPGDCTVVPVATSPEQRQVVTDLALTFNGDRVEVDGRCVFVIPRTRAAASVVEQLTGGWPAREDDPAPALWIPASTSWSAVLDERLQRDGRGLMAQEGPVLLRSPVVVALPEPLAEALEEDDRHVGWTDLARLASDERGWGSVGEAQWGRFRLGTAHPDWSTVGAAALVSRTLAGRGDANDAPPGDPATGDGQPDPDQRTSDDGTLASDVLEGLPEPEDEPSSEAPDADRSANDPLAPLTVADVYDPATSAFVRMLEESVIHYGSDPEAFLVNWYTADQRGDPARYLSAAVVTEHSVIAYNRGLLDGLAAGEGPPPPPRTPLVAVYPDAATIVLESPLLVLDAPWVTEQVRRGAEAFVAFAVDEAGQEIVRSHGFRPGDPDAAVGPLVTPGNGVDPLQPSHPAPTPTATVLAEALDHWQAQRRPTRLVVLVDTAGLDGPVADDPLGRTHGDLLSAALLRATDSLDPHTKVALWLAGDGAAGQGAVVAADGVLEDIRPQLRAALHQLPSSEGGATVEATREAFLTLVANHDPSDINALLVIGSGHQGTDTEGLDTLVALVEEHHDAHADRPVRVFTVAYGDDADLPALRRLAGASGATSYNASEPPSIEAVIDAAVANF